MSCSFSPCEINQTGHLTPDGPGWGNNKPTNHWDRLPVELCVDILSLRARADAPRRVVLYDTALGACDDYVYGCDEGAAVAAAAAAAAEVAARLAELDDLERWADCIALVPVEMSDDEAYDEESKLEQRVKNDPHHRLQDEWRFWEARWACGGKKLGKSTWRP
mgnify:CR=1 FL=1